MLNLLQGILVVLGLVFVPSTEPAVEVPRVAPTAVVIDGVHERAEWGSAAVVRLAEGTTIRLQHDGRHLFIGIVAVQPGFPSVCTGRGDSVQVLHASAALGSVRYTGATDSWTTRDTAFAYGMRNPDTTNQARLERRAYLARHGWLSSTFRMSRGLTHETQISIDLLDRVPRLALGYFVTGTSDTWSILPWPSSLPLEDDCADARLVRGYVPARLHFAPAGWVELRLER